MWQLDATRTAKKVISMMAEAVKKKFYSESDQIRAVGDDFIVTKSDGTMEKVEIPEMTFKVDDETKVTTIELTKIIRTPYKKGNK
jgi:Cu/Ag efflux protein CusF